ADVRGRVIGEHGVRGAIALVDALERHIHERARRNLPAQRDGGAIDPRTGAFTGALAVVIQPIHSEGEFVARERALFVERDAAAAPGIPARGEAEGVAAE